LDHETNSGSQTTEVYSDAKFTPGRQGDIKHVNSREMTVVPFRHGGTCSG
jgi:hypothetical protein